MRLVYAAERWKHNGSDGVACLQGELRSRWSTRHPAAAATFCTNSTTTRSSGPLGGLALRRKFATR